MNLESDWQVTLGLRQIGQMWHFQSSTTNLMLDNFDRLGSGWIRSSRRRRWLLSRNLDYGSFDKNLDYGSNKSSFCRQVPFHWRSPSVIIALLPQARRPAAACEHIISDISDWSESFPPLLQTVTISDIQYPGVNIDCSVFQYHLSYSFPTFNPSPLHNEKDM